MISFARIRSISTAAALTLLMQTGMAVPPAAAIAEVALPEPTTPRAASVEPPPVPKPMTLAERQEQVARIVAGNESDSARTAPNAGWVEQVYQLPTGSAMTLVPQVNGTMTAPHAELSARTEIPDPPTIIGPWADWVRYYAPPGQAAWSVSWNVYWPSKHIAVYRASDDVKIVEHCSTHQTGPHPTLTDAIAFYVPDTGSASQLFKLGELYYAKVAVSPTISAAPTPPPTQDWSCATDWSEEATSPAWPAVATPPELLLPETIACGYDNATGRPCFQAHRGDPVNTANASLNEAIVDAEIPAPGVNFRLTRTYSSSNTVSFNLGPRWALSYPGLLYVSDGSALFRADNGSYAYFEHVSGNQWHTSSKGAQMTLVGSTETGFTLTNHEQHTFLFNEDGWMSSWKDRSGNGLTFTYDEGNLVSVVDAAGRTVTFTYNESGDRVTRVDLPDGRWVGYSYTDGRLTGVRDLNGGTTTYTYNSVARLTSITDPNGNLVMQTTYDSSGRVIEQTDATGTTITPNWGSSVSNFPDNNGGIWTDIYRGSVLAEQIDPYGEVTSYYYDYDNPTLKPTEITDPDGNVTTMTYDERGNLLTRTAPEPFDFTETWVYDTANNITSYTDGEGNTSTYTYDSADRLAAETDPLGGVTSYTYTSTGQLETVTTAAGRTTGYGYDSAGNVTSVVTPAGNETTYTYDAGGRMLTVTGPRGNVAGADPADHTTSYTYDDAGHVTSVTDPLGRTTSYGYDANGNRTSMTDPAGHTTTYTFDAANRLTEVTDPAGNTTTTSYDPVGNVTAVTDPTGATTSYAYDAANRLARVVSPRGNAPGADPDDFTTSYGYDVNGNLTTVTDPTGAITTTAFDALNRAVSVTDPLGNTTSYGYDAADNEVSTTDPTGAVTANAYDGNHRLTAVTDAVGNTTSYGYDADGHRTSQVSPTGNTTSWAYDLDGRMVGVTDPRGNAAGADPVDFTTSFTYDEAGNRTRVIDPLGRTVRTHYNPANEPIRVVDPAGNPTVYRYDSRGHVSKVIAATGGETAYNYDQVGNLKTVTNPLGGEYTYTYDSAGRVAAATTPTGRTTSYAYTLDGQPATVTLPSGSVSYTYDAAGRTTGVDYSDATPDLTYVYDLAGRTASASNGTSTAEYDYDDAGRVTDITRAGQVFGYDYDDAGNLTGRTLPDGRTQTYTWDADSRITATTITAAGGSHDISYGYDPAGHLTSVTRQGGPSTGYAYDAASSLTLVEHTAAGSTLLAQSVTWSPAGSPTVIATTRDGATVTRRYSYDSTGRVTGVCLPASGTTCGTTDPETSYTYDLNGNRAETVIANTGDDSTTTYTYDDDDRPTGQTVDGIATAISYDANGFLASQTGPAGTRDFDYDLDANLRTVELEDGQTIGYGYDEAGNRVNRTVDAVLDASWSWDTLGLPTRLDERDGTDTLTHQWWADPLADLGGALADTAGGTPAWLLGDHQGSITGVADATTLTGSGDLDPYGSPTGADTGDYADNPLRFHGQYLDHTTGLYDVRARDYDAATGRFTSPDPVAAAAGTAFIQTYHYGYNRPTVLTDPTGLCPIICTAIIGGVAGAAVGGIDCWLSGDDRNTCLTKIAVGAAAGALTGATLGAGGSAAAGLYGGVSTGTQIAGGIVAGGAGSVLYGSGVAAATGQPYSYGNAANDFLWGAAGSAGGVAAGTVAQRAAARTAGFQAANCPAPTGHSSAHGYRYFGKPDGPGRILIDGEAQYHIISGNRTGGGHKWPGQPGKSVFPPSWDTDKILDAVVEVATDPSSNWTWQRGVHGSLYTKNMKPSRVRIDGKYDGIKIRVIFEPVNDRVITAHPIG